MLDKNTSEWLDQILGRNTPGYTGDWSKALPEFEQHLNTVVRDRWDKEILDEVRRDMADFDAGELTLAQVMDEEQLAGWLWNDAFMAMFKPLPVLRDQASLDPRVKRHHQVVEQLLSQAKTKALRQETIGDEFAAALAVINLRSELEDMLEELEMQQDLAEKIQDLITQLQQLMAQMGADPGTEDGMAALVAAGLGADGESDEDGDGEGEGSGGQGDGDGEGAGGQSLDDMVEQFNQLSEQLAEALEQAGLSQDAQGLLPMKVNAAMRSTMDTMNEMSNMGRMWGLEPSDIKKLDAKERMELAERFQNDRLRDIANLFGKMRREMVQLRKETVITAPHEAVSVTTGSDLSLTLPSEFMYLLDDTLELDFYYRLTNDQLLEFEMTGKELANQGPIIWIEDGSGSMHGEKEKGAKAVGLCLLELARTQDRPFTWIHFGSTGVYQQWHFAGAHEITPDKIIEVAEWYNGGGTCFFTPLQAAMDKLIEEETEFGATRSDIVFCTDGYAGLTDDFIENYRSELERMETTIWGVFIPSAWDYSGDVPEVMHQICDEVLKVDDLTDTSQMADIFTSIQKR